MRGLPYRFYMCEEAGAATLEMLMLALRAHSGGPGALQTPHISFALNVFLCNQVNGDSINIYTSSLHTKPRLTKREDGPDFFSMHSTLHAACRGLREECRRNQCVLISHNPHRNSPVSQIVSALIKGPPSLVVNQSFYSVQAALTGARTSYPVAS